MAANLEFGNLINPDEGERLAAILAQCFNSSLSASQGYFYHLGLENFRVVRQAGKIAGGLAIYRMGQWFGSRNIPMAGIAAVGVSPEFRGLGVATQLMRSTLQELHAEGIPLSTLYPATQILYRQVGYEQGGAFCTWEMPINDLKLSDRALPVEPVSATPSELLCSLYHRWATQTNGHLDRHPALWDRILQPPGEETIYVYLIGFTSQPEGYVIFTQKGEDYISIRDWVALTPAANRRVWTLIADHRSQIPRVQWYGSLTDPCLLLFPEQTVRMPRLAYWMLRVVNVAQALEKRGYPEKVEGELHLQVSDLLLPENQGKFVLTVSGGRGEVTPGGRGDLQLDISGLAPLYTGLFTPYQLQVVGQLESTDEALNFASQLFAGSQPWMPDFF